MTAHAVGLVLVCPVRMPAALLAARVGFCVCQPESPQIFGCLLSEKRLLQFPMHCSYFCFVLFRLLYVKLCPRDGWIRPIVQTMIRVLADPSTCNFTGEALPRHIRNVLPHSTRIILGFTVAVQQPHLEIHAMPLTSFDDQRFSYQKIPNSSASFGSNMEQTFNILM